MNVSLRSVVPGGTCRTEAGGMSNIVRSKMMAMIKNKETTKKILLVCCFKSHR